MSSLVQLSEGMVFAGDFRVVRPLSAGGMGAVYVVEQVSTGMQRALKPENIYLLQAKRAGVQFMVKVLDFGIAKIVADAKKTETAALGSPMWMSPEQTARGHQISPASDVWALGLIGFHVLTGRYY